MMRLFVALDLPETVRQRLAMLQAGLPNARWIRAENLHVTLRFIGEVEEHRAQDLDSALSRIEAPAFDLTLVGVDFFGPDRKPQSLLAVVERSDPLQFLRDKVDRAVAAAGLGLDDRKFRPHVTLGRLRGGPHSRTGRWLGENGLLRAGPVPVTEFVLYRSHLGHEGSVYEPLAAYSLKVDASLDGAAGDGSEGLAAQQAR